MSDTPAEREGAASPTLDHPVTRRLLRWLPLAMAGHLFIGLPALLISLVVAYGTYVQAGATQRMQQAATWPYLAYDSSNYTTDGKHRINMTLTNNGVGPALLGPMEVRYGGRAMRTPQELLAACCGYKKGESMQFATTPPTNVALRPGEQIAFFDMPDIPVNARMIESLERERWNIRVRSCYCSIFEECWIIEGVQAKPQPVSQCPSNWTVYRER
jgi:hypothetical protein